MSDAFLRDPVVITPEQAIDQQPADSQQLGADEGPETLVVCQSTGLRDLLVDTLEAEAQAMVGPATLHVSESFGGAGVLYPGMGAPAAAYAVERCIAAGTRRAFSLGFGGAVSPLAEMGEVCLIDRALPHDGLTSHYAGPGYEPAADRGLTRTLREALQWGRQGPVWTTDAPYRQTVSSLERLREQEVLAVDMATGAVLTVAAYREVPAGALVVTTDVLRGQTWVPCEQGAADEAVTTAVRGLVAVLKGLRNLSRSS